MGADLQNAVDRLIAMAHRGEVAEILKYLDEVIPGATVSTATPSEIFTY